jgi:ABC-2 type transport system permease protein
MVLAHTRAILWAQLRTLANFYTRGGNRGATIFTVIMSALWYSAVGLGAWTLFRVTSSAEALEPVRKHASKAVFFTFAYWQLVPLMLGAAGAALDLKRLTVYPVTSAQLFLIETVLRFSTGVEVLILTAGAAFGVASNRAFPAAAALGFIPWIAFNLLLSIGIRDLVSRLLAGRRTREIVTLLLVLLAGTPQVLAYWTPPPAVRAWIDSLVLDWTPWSLTAGIVFRQATPRALAGMAVWMALAFWFGWSQFHRSLRFDEVAARAGSSEPGHADGLLDWFFRLPSRLLPDPLGAVAEKELRFLSRTPRFRMVFLMGFSFGLLIWLPLASRPNLSSEIFGDRYLTFVTMYALLLLGEVLFWNVFGFDRSAAQIYYLLPVPFSKVLAGKNIAAAVFVALEVALVAAVCALFKMPISAEALLECVCVASVMTAFLMAAGNLGSTYYPRPASPGHSWRSSSAGRVQAAFVFLYPVLGFPVGLAYMARWAFDSEWMFWLVLAFAALLAAVVYWIALESAVERAESHREQFVTALASGEGPIAS